MTLINLFIGRILFICDNRPQIAVKRKSQKKQKKKDLNRLGQYFGEGRIRLIEASKKPTFQEPELLPFSQEPSLTELGGFCKVYEWEVMGYFPSGPGPSSYKTWLKTVTAMGLTHQAAIS